MSFTTDDFVNNVLLFGYVPDAQNNFPPTTILTVASKVLFNFAIPELVSLDSGYFIETEDYPFIGGVSEYTFSQYAMWNKLRRIDKIVNGRVYPLTRIEYDQLYLYDTTSNSDVSAFYLKNDVICFVNPPSSGTTDLFRVHIYRRPGEMVPTNQAAKVQSVNYATGAVTYTAVPPSTYTNSSHHDFYSSTSPFKRIQTNITATNIAANVQTFPVASVQTLLTGDYVCVLNQTVYPPLPEELHQFLIDLTIIEMDKITMDADEYQLRKQSIIDSVRGLLKSAPGQRVTGQAKKLTLRGNGLVDRYGLIGRYRWY